LFTGDVYSSNENGYDKFGQITIEEDKPLRLEIQAIFGQITESTL
jgi:hypothetical protein